MMEKIIKHLNELESEVQDIHPLLINLFPKMKGITHIEYKQGASENGADFVLVKKDEQWGREEYVGVIVKKDKITKSSHDVNRQIEECINMERTIQGTKIISLNEVWVITTKNISISAQDFFSKKFLSSKIKFFGEEELAKIISEILPNYFRGLPTIINNYIVKNRERVLNIERNSQFIVSPLHTIKVEQDLIPISKNKYKKNEEVTQVSNERTTISKISEKKSVCLIEGGMGSGKSSMLRNFAIKMLDEDNYSETKKIPIYITFKELELNHEFDINELIKIEFDNSLPKDTTIIILLDGIDESKLSAQKLTEIIDKIISQADSSENIRLIMSARNVEDSTLKEKSNRSFRSYRIAPLSLNKIIDILQSTCTEINLKNRLIEDLKKSTLYKALPKTPIATILLAKLLSENQREIPSNLTELYAKFTEFSLGRWDLISKGLSSEKEYSVKDAVVKKIARYFIDNDLTKISLDEARDFFKNHLKDRNLGLDYQNVFQSLIDRCDLFWVDESTNTISFKHRTFAEFFYAKGLDKKTPNEVSENDFDFYWAAINFFWVGIKKDCPEIIEKFSQVSCSSDKLKILKIVNMSNILLAGYETPYHEITSSIKSIFIEASELYVSICNRKTESFLSKFPQMTILAIFRYLMADSYSYEFFSDAINEAIIEIEDLKDFPDDVKATTLFLLDTAQVTPNNERLFWSIANKEFINRAPLAIQLAIGHESRQRKLSNDSSKKIHRNIKNLFEKKGFKQHLESMYSLPINKIKLK